MPNTPITASPGVAALIAAMPPFGDMTIGTGCRAVIASRIEAATPGSHSEMWGTGPTFRSIFFPDYAPVRFEDRVGSAFGLDDAYFAAWAVALLCQAMDHTISDLHPQMLTDKINADLATRNAATAGFPRAAWYGYVLSASPGPVEAAFAALPDHAAALQEYISALGAQQWVNFKMAEGPNWTHPEWEMFHHYAKLAALGGTQTQIDALIGTMKSLGLSLPAEADTGQWTAYAPWGNAIDYTAIIQEARPGMTRQECTPYPEGSSCMDDENSWEFTANSQPGSAFRTSPPSSCLGADAQVRMADATLKAISAIEVGEEVESVDGPRRVMHVVRSTAGDRPLYGFEGQGFAFTGTHPFVTADGSPARYVAASAFDTVHALPGLGEFGVGQFGAGDVRLAASVGGKLVAVAAPLVTARQAAADTEVFDLVLELDADGTSSYFAGDSATQYLVASEMPRFAHLPEATEAFVSIFERAAPVCARAVESHPSSKHHELLLSGLVGAAQGIVPRAAQRLARTHDGAVLTAVAARDRGAALLDAAGPLRASSLAGPAGPAFAALAAVMAPRVRLAASMGWRALDQAPPEIAEFLAMDIDAIALNDLSDIRFEEGQDLIITLKCGQSSLRRALPLRDVRGESALGVIVHETAYFSDWRPAASGAEPWVAAFAVGSCSGTPVRLGACHLLGDNQQSSAFCSVPIFAASGAKAGRLGFEARRLTSAQVLAERDARKAWSPGRASAFARSLGSAVGDLLAEEFDMYFDAFADRISLHPLAS